jgi:2-isopropylmalate synthase
VTEGQDALGEVVVKIEYGNRHFLGRATSTDILRASAEAYVDALNHVETFRAREKLEDHKAGEDVSRVT